MDIVRHQVNPYPRAGSLPPVESLASLEGGIIAALGSQLAVAGYTQQVVFDAEAIAPAQIDAVRLPVVQWNLARQPQPAQALARLFVYSDAVSEGEVHTALGPTLTENLLSAGLLLFAGSETIRSHFRLVPLEGLWILSDPPDAGGEAVMGPGITTLDLIHLMPRHPGAVLDLGCGAGTLALLAAVRGAPRAVGVDINSRAVALARFNARLNQNSAEFRVGDLVEPVAGERFDQVFSQPPYVVQPPGVAATTYLHGGPSGDELAIRFAAAVPAVLAPRGRAIFYFDSALGPRRPLRDRLNDALGSAPVDLHILAAPGPSPDLQAVAYASIEVPDLGESYPETVRRYREHLESTGASRFIRALVILTRSDRSGERTSFQLPAGGFSGLDAEALDAFLSGLDLSRAPDTELLATPVRVSPQARFVEEHLPSDPQGEPKRSIRFERRALGTDREISEGGQALFAALQAAPSVAAAVETFAAACEEEPAAVMKEVIGFVRDGLARALLVRG